MPQPRMEVARHTPLPVMVKGIPLYVATPSSLTRKSGWICSNTFFFGLSWASGVPTAETNETLHGTGTSLRQVCYYYYRHRVSEILVPALGLGYFRQVDTWL